MNKRTPSPLLAPKSRRRFLGGAAAAVSLPFLPSLLTRRARAHAGACDPPKRFLAYYWSLGALMNDWTPSATGKDWTPTKNLQSLQDLKDDILVISGLKCTPPKGGTAHVSAVSSVLTATGVAPSKTNLRAGISIDQLIAQKIGSCTRLGSLQLGHEHSTGDEKEYSGVYGQTVSWKDPTTPLRKIISPRAAFERVFEGLDPDASAAESAERIAQRKSVLDAVRSEAESVHARLNPSDRRAMDQYLSGLRELEMGLSSGGTAAAGCAPLDAPEDDDYPKSVDHMTRLMAMAFQCDITRSISYMMHDGGTNRNFAFMGEPGSFHNDISHHGNNGEKKKKYSNIVDWEVSQFAKLLEALKQVDDGNGQTALDNTVVYMASNISDGDSHARNNLPVIVAGGGAGFNLGHHLKYSGSPQTGRLLLSILRSFDPSIEKFGATGDQPLDGLNV